MKRILLILCLFVFNYSNAQLFKTTFIDNEEDDIDNNTWTIHVQGSNTGTAAFDSTVNNTDTDGDGDVDGDDTGGSLKVNADLATNADTKILRIHTGGMDTGIGTDFKVPGTPEAVSISFDVKGTAGAKVRVGLLNVYGNGDFSGYQTIDNSGNFNSFTITGLGDKTGGSGFDSDDNPAAQTNGLKLAFDFDTTDDYWIDNISVTGIDVKWVSSAADATDYTGSGTRYSSGKVISSYEDLIIPADIHSGTTIIHSSGNTLEMNSLTSLASSATAIQINTDKKVKVSNVLKLISGTSITLKPSGYLEVGGNLSLNSGSITLESDYDDFSSLIVEGNQWGNIKYSRFVREFGSPNFRGNLIGSPLVGEELADIISQANLANDGGTPEQFAIGPYDNSNNTWEVYTSAEITALADDEMVTGTGYQMATDNAENSYGKTIDFTGTVNTNATVNVSVINSDGNGSGGRRWNLVANPYPSFLNIGDSHHATNNFLDINSSILDGNFGGVYGYNSNGTGYTAYGLSATKYLAPGQGFMIAAQSSSAANLSFTESMQAKNVVENDFHIISDPLNDQENLLLEIYNFDELIDQTKVVFREGMSTSLDFGYDLGKFDQLGPIMTRLIENDEGVGFDTQEIPLNSIQNAVIPLVINQSAGQEFRLSLHTAPSENNNIYLVDVFEGTFTDLKEGDYILNPTSDIEGVGRFFIHMSNETMSDGEVSTTMLSAYKDVNANYITLEGLATQSNNINVSLYNILGRKILKTSFGNNINMQTISTLGMASGIYIIELDSGNERLTKKIIIQ